MLIVVVASCWLASCDRSSEARERLAEPHHAEDLACPVHGDDADGGAAWDPQPRWILSDALTNARDVGGVPLCDGASVAYGALFRGPPLGPLTAAACEELEQLGIRTVIDLRIDSERQAQPEASCVSDNATVISSPLPVPYNVSPADYVADLNTFASIARAFQELGDPESYPIYIHCSWGRDRTGVLTAVILRALGVSRPDIMREYSLSRASVGAYPDSLAGVLDEIESQGGIARYLASAGVAPERIDALRMVLTRDPAR